MPVPDQRDPLITQAKLESWLGKQLTSATGVRVLRVRTPTANGFSSETLMFDAELEADGDRQPWLTSVVQRRTLRSGKDLHPLQERIMRIHVAEEARHISFARSYLRSHVPELGWLHRRALGLMAPVILGVMVTIMLSPPRAMVRHFGIPRQVLSEAYGKNPASRRERRACVGRVRALATELGLVTPVSKRIWKLMGIWADDDPGRGPAT